MIDLGFGLWKMTRPNPSALQSRDLRQFKFLVGEYEIVTVSRYRIKPLIE